MDTFAPTTARSPGVELLLLLVLPLPIIGVLAFVRAMWRGPRAASRYVIRRASYRTAPRAMRAAGDVRAMSKGRYPHRLIRRHAIRRFRRRRW